MLKVRKAVTSKQLLSESGDWSKVNIKTVIVFDAVNVGYFFRNRRVDKMLLNPYLEFLLRVLVY